MATTLRSLSAAQRAALINLSREKWISAYEARATLKTLEALKKKGLVRDQAQVGYFSMPRTAIEWILTDEGLRLRREALNARG